MTYWTIFGWIEDGFTLFRARWGEDASSTGVLIELMKRTPYELCKRAGYFLLDIVGLNAFFRYRNRDKLRVFALHGIGDFDGPNDWLPLRQQLDVNDFERYLNRLRKHYQFLSMDDATKVLKGEMPVVSNAAVMTLDDGYLNNFTQALPILRKYDVPGTFYVATGFIESREPFWFDRLDFVLQAAAQQNSEFSVGGKKFSFDSSEREAVAEKYTSLRDHCKKSYPNDARFTGTLSNLAGQLEQETGVSLESLLEQDKWASIISWEKVATFGADKLVTFGGHTVSHLRLSCASGEQVKRELNHSKEQIESWSGKPCVHFAYPNGDYDSGCAKAVRAAGYDSAVTSDFGLNSVGDDTYTIKRLDIVVGCSEAELLARASGLEEAVISVMSKMGRLVQSLGGSSDALPENPV